MTTEKARLLIFLMKRSPRILSREARVRFPPSWLRCRRRQTSCFMTAARWCLPVIMRILAARRAASADVPISVPALPSNAAPGQNLRENMVAAVKKYKGRNNGDEPRRWYEPAGSRDNWEVVQCERCRKLRKAPPEVRATHSVLLRAAIRHGTALLEVVSLFVSYSSCLSLCSGGCTRGLPLLSNPIGATSGTGYLETARLDSRFRAARTDNVCPHWLLVRLQLSSCSLRLSRCSHGAVRLAQLMSHRAGGKHLAPGGETARHRYACLCFCLPVTWSPGDISQRQLERRMDSRMSPQLIWAAHLCAALAMGAPML